MIPDRDHEHELGNETAKVPAWMSAEQVANHHAEGARGVEISLLA
jgi:hypothetical protein